MLWGWPHQGGTRGNGKAAIPRWATPHHTVPRTQNVAFVCSSVLYLSGQFLSNLLHFLPGSHWVSTPRSIKEDERYLRHTPETLHLQRVIVIVFNPQLAGTNTATMRVSKISWHKYFAPGLRVSEPHLVKLTQVQVHYWGLSREEPHWRPSGCHHILSTATGKIS